MTIKEVLQLGRAFSQDRMGDLDLEVLLSHVLSKGKEYLFAHPEHVVNHDRIGKFTSLVKRYLNGEPVAYLTGEKEFYGLALNVDKRVLIPRPETEYLVDKVIKTVKENRVDSRIAKILDIGTGSGNIAIAVAYNLPDIHMTASDVSLDALEVAKKNVNRYNLKNRVLLVHSDLLENIQADDYGIIVANLPYIGTTKHNFVAKETKNHEPHEALFGGLDGLKLYEKFFEQMSDWHKTPNYIFGEIGFLQGEDLKKMIKQFYPGAFVKIEKDLTGLDRYFIINSLC
ncbi:peptide chain release factor N(5)-glutamine methyltransferase [bacterium]|nr:peptide chain release factor N(5)-glutamine methyltransferase [bacterium]